MQNTAVQKASQGITKLSSSAKKSTTTSDKTNSTAEENVDPYLQIFMSLLSQTQAGGDNQSQQTSDTASENVGQITTQQSILSMLNTTGMQAVADILSTANTQNTADLQSTAHAQSTTDLQSSANLQSSADLQSTANTQSVSDLLSSMNIQSVADIISALNLQSSTNSQSTDTADLQSAANLQNVVNALRAAIVQSAANTTSASDSQSTASSQGALSLKGIESSDISQASSDSQSLSDLQQTQGSVLKELQNSDGTESGTTAQTAQAVTASLNQAAADKKDALDVKPDSLSQTAELSETQNTGNKTAVRPNSTTTAENSGTADLSAAKDGSETVAKSTDSSSTDTGTKSSEKEIDLSKLQGNSAQSKEISTYGTDSKTTEKVAEPKVTEQIATDVSKNLTLGKNEFTIKLKPESLGEITVKLSEENGKTTLSITTASANTAKLINDDLNDLKAAVSQMNVHVNEAVAKTSDTQQGSMQQFSMAGQQSNGQQYSGGQAYSSSAYSTAENSESGYSEKVTIQTQNLAAKTNSSGSIDTYI